MSLTAAFHASRSGLTATARWAELTSANIANATQPGYARRTLLRTTTGAGTVHVTGLQREVDASLERMFRRELSRTATQQALAGGLSAYTDWLGDTDNPAGLPARLTALQSGFDLLANNPADSALQRNVVEAAKALTAVLNQASATLDTTAANAEAALRQDLARANQSLESIGRLNAQMTFETEGSAGRAAIEDQLAQELDALAEIADITVRRDTQGHVSVFTAGGTVLLDGGQTNLLAWDSTTGTLTAGGTDVTPGRDGVRGFAEGSLGGNVLLVTRTVPGMRRQLDEVARALVQGFEAADGSLVPGMAGLFTDAGAAWSGSAAGLAARIAVNDAVRPERGGALWRLRDGMGALVEGPASDNSRILAFVAVLEQPQSFDPAAGLGTSATLGGYAASLVSAQQNQRVTAETQHEALAAGLQAVEQSRYAIQGVNIDDELQQLADIEQAYAANSQVLRTLTQMLDDLLAAI